MADPALSTSRRALLGAAAALPLLPLSPTVRPEPVEGRPALLNELEALWHERLSRYRRLATRAKAVAETGWFRAANDRYNGECATPGGDRKAAFSCIDRAEDLYWRRCTDPMQKAAAALALTPAPDLEALRAKITVIRTHELHELECMSRNCFEVLEEDVDRLGTAPPLQHPAISF